VVLSQEVCKLSKERLGVGSGLVFRSELRAQVWRPMVSPWDRDQKALRLAMEKDLVVKKVRRLTICFSGRDRGRRDR
jgi:hypothetical protein